LLGTSIKILPSDISATIRFIKKEYESLFPDYPFEYSYLNTRIDRQYDGDQRLSVVISNFAFIAIMIACFGLFGLSFYLAVRKTKVIGIRKAHGASTRTIFIWLSREFIKWILISVLIAFPLAWIIMKKWFLSFAYHTNISWWIYPAAILVTLSISFITVAWHAWKTARTNPIEVLRYEW
jgi:putative ABC transport system permease protein